MRIIANGETLPLIIACSVATNRYSKSRPIRAEFFQQQPATTVRQSNIAYQDIAPGFRNLAEGGFHLSCHKDLVAQMLYVQFDVSHCVFVIFDQEHSEGLHKEGSQDS